ncbi:hypothetical protein Tco_0675561 [Tanacetum coccineum]
MLQFKDVDDSGISRNPGPHSKENATTKLSTGFRLTSKTKMLLKNAYQNCVVLDEEVVLFLAENRSPIYDDDVDDLAPRCGPWSLKLSNPIYDEAGPSYDSNTPFEVQAHDTFVDHMDEYHEVHKMQSDVQHNYVVDSDADYTSDSNIIPYDQYVEDNEEHVVQSNVSSVQNDALMSILDEMHWNQIITLPCLTSLIHYL